MNSMSECEQTLLVQADFDGELDAAQSAALVRHREECERCRAVQETLMRARTLLRAAPHYGSSTEQRQRLERAITEGAERRERAPSSAPAARWGAAGGGRRPWGRSAAWAAAAAVVLVSLSVLVSPRRTDVASQLVNNHLRAMQLDSHLVDVVSTDHHTVKPWFAGKVDFAPPVKQLDAEGYMLKGGRIDVVDARTAAVLVYQAGRHEVEVFVWPARAGAALSLQSQQRNGFNLRHWEDAGFEVWCVSDMAADELARFASRWRAAA